LAAACQRPRQDRLPVMVFVMQVQDLAQVLAAQRSDVVCSTFLTAAVKGGSNPTDYVKNRSLWFATLWT
jgi:hypothetical protein